MARSSQQINFGVAVAGTVAILLVAGALSAPLVKLWLTTDGDLHLSKSDWSAVRFSILQASLSAVLSILLAIPVARALARRKFLGRGVVITLLGAPFLLPVIVAVLGLLAIWGRSGIVSQMLLAIGGERLSIYGLSGVVLAHVFFNAPLVTRLILMGWSNIPDEHFRLSAQLGMTARDVQIRLEWPMLRAILPGAFLMVFLLCITSFAVVLALGGGPRATTIELAIYQAVRFDFNLPKAALLGLIQFGICALLALFMLRTTVRAEFGHGSLVSARRWDVSSRWLLWQDRVLLVFTSLFIGGPLAAITLKGLPNILELPKATWQALTNSLLVAITSAVFALILAFIIAIFIDALKSRNSRLSGVAEAVGLLTLSMSPFVLGTGLFLLVYPFADPFMLALPITALVNALMSLPFALRTMLPAIEQNRVSYGNLSDSLGLSGWARFRITLWPALKQPVGFAMGLSAALSMGDLGVVALFAPPDVETLPLLMYRLMGAYRMADAASVALILVVVTLSLFWAFDRGGRFNVKTR